MRYVVVDLEATCWPDRRMRDRMEIIEIGALELDASAEPTGRQFQRFVRPVVEPTLSSLCTRLTSITQYQVDAAEAFQVVFPAFLEWIGPGSFAWCSWGLYDQQQLRQDCRRHGIILPAALERHINLKQEFARLFSVRRCGMTTALQHAGIPLEGTHHRAIDDARNIAQLARLILPRLDT